MERMTVEEMAKYIGASAVKVYAMVRANEIPHYKIGAKILFRKSTIDQWIAEQEAQASGK
ncbi:helix-turn-helix domain-containing protein [Paenibacillus woosongensis]|uniref:Helix-turn-helix domain-containing protein n=1 Tax=Paenibacillus woosongensis TaxID=307580 RepID=A0A7X2YX53_9BACL|nr:helix-turn-helix domain-containing protein [Paenibacillus woosongensis]MUG43449.1 helix-turn-helix domain-containing protein [Paenibacillus woosongensis]